MTEMTSNFAAVIAALPEGEQVAAIVASGLMSAERAEAYVAGARLAGELYVGSHRRDGEHRERLGAPMTGAIPAYGKYFRRERADYVADLDLSSTIYRYKTNGEWYVRSNRASKQWFIFWAGQQITAAPFATLTLAMSACRGAAELLAS